MIQRILRPLWLPLMLALVMWSSFGVAGYFAQAPSEGALLIGAAQQAAEDAEGSTISIGGFLKDSFDPWVIGFALLVTLVFAKWTGFRLGIKFVFANVASEKTPVSDAETASRFLIASKALGIAGRGILWGTFLANTIYVATLPWFGEFPEWGRWRYARGMYSRDIAVAMLVLGPLFLMPLARRARHLANTNEGAGKNISPLRSKLGSAIDVISVVGIVAGLYLQTLVTFTARVIGTDPKLHSNVQFYSPTFESVSMELVAWSAVLVATLSVLACVPPILGSFGRVDWRQLGFNALVSGALGVFVLYHAGVVYFLRNGGQADPQVMKQLGGLMLVPLCIGVAFYLLTRFAGTPKVKGD